MTEKEKPPKEEKVACEICMKEIPISAAKIDEVSDYVAHFCGLECHSKWIAQDKKDEK